MAAVGCRRKNWKTWECLRITSRCSTVLNMAATLRISKIYVDGRELARFDTIFHFLLQGDVGCVEGQYSAKHDCCRKNR